MTWCDKTMKANVTLGLCLLALWANSVQSGESDAATISEAQYANHEMVLLKDLTISSPLKEKSEFSREVPRVVR